MLNFTFNENKTNFERNLALRNEVVKLDQEITKLSEGIPEATTVQKEVKETSEKIEKLSELVKICSSSAPEVEKEISALKDKKANLLNQIEKFKKIASLKEERRKKVETLTKNNNQLKLGIVVFREEAADLDKKLSENAAEIEKFLQLFTESGETAAYDEEKTFEEPVNVEKTLAEEKSEATNAVEVNDADEKVVVKATEESKITALDVLENYMRDCNAEVLKFLGEYALETKNYPRALGDSIYDEVSLADDNASILIDALENGFAGLNEVQSKKLAWSLPSKLLNQLGELGQKVIEDRNIEDQYYDYFERSEFRPAFTYNTVRRLNGIVKVGNVSEIEGFFSEHTDYYVEKKVFFKTKAIPVSEAFCMVS